MTILRLFLQRAALLSFLALPLSLRAQMSFDRNLPAGASPDVYVSTGSGSIRVIAGTGNEIRIHARLTAGSMHGWFRGSDSHDVDARMRRIAANPPITQSGNSVRIGDVRPEERGLYNGISIDYEISAPRDAALNLHSGSGDVTSDGLGRFVKAESGSGTLQIHGLNGPGELRTGSGDIDLRENGHGDVHAVTGSGSIRIAGLAGSLDARTGSGDIEASGALAGVARLQSGSGSIHLHLGPQAHFDLEASTGSGSINVSQPGAPHGGEERHHVNAPINGGGPLLHAQTGSGDIRID